MNTYLLVPSIGLILGCYLPYTPFYWLYATGLCLVLSMLCYVFWRKQHTTLSVLGVLFMLAVGYSSNWLHTQVSYRLPLALDKTKVAMQVEIIQRQTQAGSLSLWVKPLHIQSNAQASLPALRNLKLNWYWRTENDKQAILNAQKQCQIAQINATLRAPKNFANWQPFDYEAYLLLQKQDASGYIGKFTCLSKSSSSDKMGRETLLKSMQAKLPSSQFNWVSALIFGNKNALTKDQWQLAKETGVVHLFVVSGLHLGLLAGLISLLGMGLIRLLAFAFNRSLYHHRLPLVLLILSICGLYAWTSGLGVSVKRAWIMLLLLNLYWLSALKPPPLRGLLLALLLLLWHQPLLHLSAGFMYSFMAVATLLLVFYQRKNSRLEALWLPQWVIFLAMLGVSSYWFGAMSSAALLANLVAIAYLALVLLPLTFVVALFPSATVALVHESAAELLIDYLHWCLSLPAINFTPLPLLLIVVWLSFLWLLNMNGRSLWQIACLSVALSAYALFVQDKQSGLFVLDVGQGQSLLLSTPQHLLVYDVGAAFSPNFNAGDAIVAPAIWRLGFKQIDSLIVSHSDNDHAGGISGLKAANIQSKQRFLGQPLSYLSGQSCHQKGLDTWQTLHQHLSIRFLHTDYKPPSDNDYSCVLQFRWYALQGLVLGDVSSHIESQLVTRYAKTLKSDVLVIAHHGSKSSTSEDLLKAVMPNIAIISAGFNNRFGHPHKSVLARLKQQGITTYNTAIDGQIQLFPNGHIRTYHHAWQPPWRQRMSERIQP